MERADRVRQKCSALSRLYVAESVWPEFKKAIVAEMAKIKIGDPSDPVNFMGPVIARPSFDKISGIITKAKEAGGEILSGGTCACKVHVGRSTARFRRTAVWPPRTADTGQGTTARASTSSRRSSRPRTRTPAALLSHAYTAVTLSA